MAYDILRDISIGSRLRDGLCKNSEIHYRLQRDERNIDNSTGLGYKEIIRRLGSRIQPLVEIINTTIDRNFRPFPKMSDKVRKEILDAEARVRIPTGTPSGKYD